MIFNYGVIEVIFTPFRAFHPKQILDFSKLNKVRAKHPEAQEKEQPL